MTNVKKIKISDLESLYSLKEWMKKTTNIFMNKDISKNNMLIILDYLEDCIKRDESIDKSSWLKLLRKLKQRAGALNE
jgi:hypothetical protein